MTVAGTYPWRVRVRLLFAWIDAAPWRTAPAVGRCIMGYPISDRVTCRRSAVNDGINGELWCKKHDKEAA